MMAIRKIISAIGIFSVVLLSSCGGPKGPKVYSCSQEIDADLGTIEESDGPVSFILKIKNTTPDLICPYTTATRCICLSANVERKPVKAGDDIMVEAVYNPVGEAGPVMEEVQVFYGTDGKLEPPYRYLSVIVKAKVNPMPHSIEEDAPYDLGQGLHMSHEVLIFNPFREGERGRLLLRAASTLHERANVSFELPEALDSVLTCRTLVLEPGVCDTVSFFLNTPHVSMDGIEHGVEIYPYVNGKRCDKPLIFKHYNQTINE